MAFQVGQRTFQGTVHQPVAPSKAPTKVALVIPADQAKELMSLAFQQKMPVVLKAYDPEVAAQLKQDLERMQKMSHDPQHLSSARDGFKQLAAVSSTHYPQEKIEALDGLIHLLENDPILEATADGVVDMVIDLMKTLNPDLIQTQKIQIQAKIVRAYGLAVELALRHYEKGNLGAITKQQKTDLFKASKAFAGLNTQHNTMIAYAVEAAKEGIVRLHSDEKVIIEVLTRLSHFGKALNAVAKKEVGTFFTEMVAVFEGLDEKIKRKWFEVLYVLRGMASKALEDMDTLTNIQGSLAAKLEANKKHPWHFGFGSHDWKFGTGAVETLGRIALHSPKQDIREAAILGTKVAGNHKLPGVADFVNFDRKLSGEAAKREDRNIRFQAVKFLAQYLEQHKGSQEKAEKSVCFQIKSLLANHVATQEKDSDIGQFLKEKVIPQDKQALADWLKQDSPTHTSAVPSSAPSKKLVLPQPAQTVPAHQVNGYVKGVNGHANGVHANGHAHTTPAVKHVKAVVPSKEQTVTVQNGTHGLTQATVVKPAKQDSPKHEPVSQQQATKIAHSIISAEKDGLPFDYTLFLHSPNDFNEVGKTLKAQESPELAVECYQRGISEFPNHLDTYKLHHNLGVTKSEMIKKSDIALSEKAEQLWNCMAHYEYALTLNPNFPSSILSLALVYNDIADCYESEGNFAQAKYFSESAIKYGKKALELRQSELAQDSSNDSKKKNCAKAYHAVALSLLCAWKLYKKSNEKLDMSRLNTAESMIDEAIKLDSSNVVYNKIKSDIRSNLN